MKNILDHIYKTITTRAVFLKIWLFCNTAIMFFEFSPFQNTLKAYKMSIVTHTEGAQIKEVISELEIAPRKEKEFHLFGTNRN